MMKRVPEVQNRPIILPLSHGYVVPPKLIAKTASQSYLECMQVARAVAETCLGGYRKQENISKYGLTHDTCDHRTAEDNGAGKVDFCEAPSEWHTWSWVISGKEKEPGWYEDTTED